MLGLQNYKDRNFLKVFRKWMTKKQLSKKIPTKFFEFLEGWKNFFCELRTFGEQWKKLNFLLLLLVASNFMLTLEIAQYFCCRRSLYFFSKSFIFYVHNFPILSLKSTYFVGPNWQQENNCSKCSLFIRPFFREIEF